MSNISLGQYLNDSPKLNNTEPVNEFLVTAIAGSMLAFAVKPLLETDFFKTMGAGLGGMFAGIGSLFGWLGKKSDKEDKDGKDKGGKDDGKNTNTNTTTKNGKGDEDAKEMSIEDKQKAANVLNARILQQDLEKKQAALKAAKTDDEKKKAQEEFDKAKRAHDIFLASAFDDDGNPVSADKCTENLKKNGLDEKAISELKKEAERISAKDFEKTVKEHNSDIMDKDGNLDEKKLENWKGQLVGNIKAAKEAVKKSEENTEGDNNRPKSDGEGNNGESGSEENTEGDNNRPKSDGKKKEKPDNSKNELKGDETDKKRSRGKDKLYDKITNTEIEIGDLKKKAENADGDEKKKIEDEIKKKEKLKDTLQKQHDKLDDKSEKEYVVTHNGKETTIIKRPKKTGDGSTWCYKNDPDQTIAPDQARAMLRASKVKEGLSLSEWLAIFCD